MLRESVLPLQPRFFIPIYLVLAIAGSAFERVLHAAAPVPVVVFHAFWLWQAAHFLLRQGALSDDLAFFLRQARRLKMSAMIAGVTYPLLLWLVFSGDPSSFSTERSYLVAFLMVAVVTAALLSLWLIAQALVRLEVFPSRYDETVRTFGAFLLLFYLPVGVFFVYPRLKTLQQSSSRQRSS